uniref:Uncharacterized protein n=1 Tax=Arundo donax TaxID=35708 RepID=A0A0A9DTL3_ARUDO
MRHSEPSFPTTPPRRSGAPLATNPVQGSSRSDVGLNDLGLGLDSAKLRSPRRTPTPPHPEYPTRSRLDMEFAATGVRWVRHPVHEMRLPSRIAAAGPSHVD